MIDRAQRDQVVAALRAFLEDDLTFEEFWGRLPTHWMRDGGVAAVVNDLDEWAEEKPWTASSTELLDAEVRRSFERVVSFLETELEYRWNWRDELPWLFRRRRGDPDLWPFYEASELENL